MPNKTSLSLMSYVFVLAIVLGRFVGCPKTGGPIMDEIRFWEIVQRVHAQSGGDMRLKCDSIRAEISSLSKSDAQAFMDIFE
jgi:hypothetical protein